MSLVCGYFGKLEEYGKNTNQAFLHKDYDNFRS